MTHSSKSNQEYIPATIRRNGHCNIKSLEDRSPASVILWIRRGQRLIYRTPTTLRHASHSSPDRPLLGTPQQLKGEHDFMPWTFKQFKMQMRSNPRTDRKKVSLPIVTTELDMALLPRNHPAQATASSCSPFVKCLVKVEKPAKEKVARVTRASGRWRRLKSRRVVEDVSRSFAETLFDLGLRHAKTIKELGANLLAKIQ